MKGERHTPLNMLRCSSITAFQRSGRIVERFYYERGADRKVLISLLIYGDDVIFLFKNIYIPQDYNLTFYMT